MKKRFSEEQIIGFLRESDAGRGLAAGRTTWSDRSGAWVA